jgi:hypothetical protein
MEWADILPQTYILNILVDGELYDHYLTLSMYCTGNPMSE